MKEQLKIEVLVDIEYVDGERQNAINEALNIVISGMMGGGKFRVEPIESKLIETSPQKFVDDCHFYDLAQGRHKCTLQGFRPKTCNGVCKDFKQK